MIFEVCRSWHSYASRLNGSVYNLYGSVNYNPQLQIMRIDSVKVRSSITFKTANRARIREQRQLEAIQTIQEHDRVLLADHEITRLIFSPGGPRARARPYTTPAKRLEFNCQSLLISIDRAWTEPRTGLHSPLVGWASLMTETSIPYPVRIDRLLIIYTNVTGSADHNIPFGIRPGRRSIEFKGRLTCNQRVIVLLIHESNLWGIKERSTEPGSRSNSKDAWPPIKGFAVPLIHRIVASTKKGHSRPEVDRIHKILDLHSRPRAGRSFDSPNRWNKIEIFQGRRESIDSKYYNY